MPLVGDKAAAAHGSKSGLVPGLGTPTAEENGEVVDVVETTSQTANKTKQLQKEGRIRNAGGTNVRDRKTKKLVDVKDKPSRISRHD